MERRKGEGRGKRSGYPLTLDIVVESWGENPWQGGSRWTDTNCCLINPLVCNGLPYCLLTRSTQRLKATMGQVYNYSVV